MNSESGALERIAEIGILPVIAVPTVDSAVPLADALSRGGIDAIEVTLRNPWALEAISRIRAAHPDMTVGAGTILDPGQVAEAKKAGAQFLVSPGFDPEMAAASQSAGLPFVPGVANPSEITAAYRRGLRTLKFFPAEISGGIAALKLYHGPFPDVRFVPTGGMTMDNIGNYLVHPFVAACGGSFMAKGELIKSGQFDRIEELCRDCLKTVREARS